MKKTIINLAVFAAVGLSTQVFGQQEKTQGAVGINIDKPHATFEVKTFDENGTSVEGVLIPRVSRLRAANMGTSVAESTLIYINSVADGTASGTTVNVDAEGFYFFKDNVWVKMGAGASKTGGGTTLDAITGVIRTVPTITATSWAEKIDGKPIFAQVQTSTNVIDLPTPSDYKYRIIGVNNQAGTGLNYGDNSPENASTLTAGKGHILMSDGAAWYIIGGSY